MDDGIICTENCIVTGNTITNYTGTAITLGLTSIFCKNTIDGGGVAGIVGGITCDAAGVPALTPAGVATLILAVFPMVAFVGLRRLRG